MTTSTKQKPVHDIRIGRIKATIWKNETERGERFNTSFSRLYRVDDDKREGPNDNGWRETSSVGRDDLLVLAKLADQVHSWIYSQGDE